MSSSSSNSSCSSEQNQITRKQIKAFLRLREQQRDWARRKRAETKDKLEQLDICMDTIAELVIRNQVLEERIEKFERAARRLTIIHEENHEQEIQVIQNIQEETIEEQEIQVIDVNDEIESMTTSINSTRKKRRNEFELLFD